MSNILTSSLPHGTISSFPQRARVPLLICFGLRGVENHSLEQVGGRVGMTRERVRQIEAKALARLKLFARTLGSFVERNAER
jgi:RNA polymerase primary sigma factor